ncbi:hypothetical protein JCM19233_3329 [Vibrio astriarenae]|nr:hypothetical protein JCM19233_3329 [Vibrio sp. C7]
MSFDHGVGSDKRWCRWQKSSSLYKLNNSDELSRWYMLIG